MYPRARAYRRGRRGRRVRRRKRRRRAHLRRKETIRICWKHFPRSYAHSRIHQICVGRVYTTRDLLVFFFQNSRCQRSGRRGGGGRKMPSKIGSLVRTSANEMKGIKGMWNFTEYTAPICFPSPPPHSPFFSSWPLMHAISVKIRARERICPARCTQGNFCSSESLALQLYCPFLLAYLATSRELARSAPASEEEEERRKFLQAEHAANEPCRADQAPLPPEDFLYFVAGSRRDRLRDRGK